MIEVKYVVKLLASFERGIEFVVFLKDMKKYKN